MSTTTNPAALEFATATLAKMIPAGLADPRELYAVACCMAEQFGITVTHACNILQASATMLQTVRL